MNPLLSAESDGTGTAFVIVEGDELQALKYQNNETGRKQQFFSNPVASKMEPKEGQGPSWSPHQREHTVSENVVCAAAEGSVGHNKQPEAGG